MSIISVTELFGSRTGTLNNVYQRGYTRSFDVTTSDPRIGPIAVRLASGIPTLGTYYQNGVTVGDPLHEYDYGAYAANISVEEDSAGGGCAWKVTVSYEPWNPAAFGPDPTLWPLRVQFGGERTERVVDFDRSGNPIRNSANDRFGDPVTVDDHIRTIVVTRNELVSSYDPALASDFSDTINNATWNGFGAGYCKMGIISTSEEQFDSNGQVWYYKVTYPISVNRGKPWRKDLLDQGYNVLTGSYGSEEPVSIKGTDGQPVSDPRCLDGAGHKLDPSGTPVVLPFEVFDEADWSGLNIDLSIRLGL